MLQVATDMTASYGDDPSMISTDTSATGMLDVIEKQLSMETTGTFWHGKTGSVLPW